MPETMTGAEMVVRALLDHGVTKIFGYTGGAALPIYDALHAEQNRISHVRVRHEQGAVHMAEGYARSLPGKVGCVLVTSGPGVTNTVTGLQDALCDSIPIVAISAQVPTHLIGNDAFQECDAVGITRPCTKHNYLVKRIEDLPRVLHEAFFIATHGRPGPVLIDIPKDVQFNEGLYRPSTNSHPNYKPRNIDEKALDAIKYAVRLMLEAKRPVFYTGGGVINSGHAACMLLRELVHLTGFPITSTLMGLGAYHASGPHWLGMLGMHGTYEANMAMHDCDVMVCIGARFDDRITGRLDAFSPDSKKIHVDIDPSSINKNVHVDVPIIGDCGEVLDAIIHELRPRIDPSRRNDLGPWRRQIAMWNARNSLAYRLSETIIKPQQAIQCLYDLTKDRDTFITTGVGQHQMWAAQHYRFNDPNRLLTSGGLGTMGYGLPAAIGVQLAHPDALVVDIDGDGSFEMTLQQLAVAAQYRLPIKVLILNNSHDGMVRQWQELAHCGRFFECVNEGQPDYVALAKAYGCAGIRCDTPQELEQSLRRMIETSGPVVVDCVVDHKEVCLPMIMSGKAHNDMMLPDAEIRVELSREGRAMV